MIENSCRKLMQRDILSNIDPVVQDEVCADECYEELAVRYAKLLDLGCYDSTNEHEAASGRLKAGSFRLACQKTTANEYCSKFSAGLWCTFL